MPDTEATAIPTTPAAVASAVLDAIEARPDAFNMNHWVELPSAILLAPDETPAYGSQMCAAGWAAHLTGWTLVSLPGDEQAEITAMDDDGDEYETLHSVYAERGDERRRICDVTAQALDLKPNETFWLTGAPTALHRLRAIAGR
jgi:hypothetical protein